MNCEGLDRFLVHHHLCNIKGKRFKDFASGSILTLRKKCPYLELFSSFFFPAFGLKPESTEYLSVFSPNAGKCRQE